MKFGKKHKTLHCMNNGIFAFHPSHIYRKSITNHKNLHIHVHSFQDWKFPDGGSVSVIMKNLMERNHHLYISARRKRSLLLGREEDIGNTFLKIIEKLPF